MNHHLILLLVFLSLESVSLKLRPSQFAQLEKKMQNSDDDAFKGPIMYGSLYRFVTVAGHSGVHLSTVLTCSSSGLCSSLLAASLAVSGG